MERHWMVIGWVFAVLLCGCEPERVEPVTAERAELTEAARAALAEPEETRFAKSRFFIAHDAFIAADDPTVVDAEAASGFLADDHEVFGFVIDGTARAYPVRMLAYHHVVNDVIGKQPIVVTY